MSRKRKSDGEAAVVRDAMQSVRSYTGSDESLLVHAHQSKSVGGMLTAKCVAILTMYGKKLDREGGSFPHENLSIPLQHVKTMIPKTIDFFRHNRREKGFRWLGFIQGVLWTQGVYTIDEMKNHNRPDGVEKTEK